MAASSDVTAGTTALAAQYNALRADAINTSTGHLHDGTNGRTHLATATPLVESSTGAVGSSTLLAREDHVHPWAVAAAHSTAGAGLSASAVECASTTVWTHCATVSLAAGTWLITAHATLSADATGRQALAAIRNSTTILASGITLAAAANLYITVGFSAIVTVATTTTISLDLLAPTGGTATMWKDTTGFASQGSYINAVKLNHG